MEGFNENFTIIEGMIPILPSIIVGIPYLEYLTMENQTQCLCSDIQKQDYGPFFLWANYITIIIALPILSVFGVFTNIINIFLYTRKQLENSANTYLLFLACSDFMVILTGLFIFWIDSARSYIPELEQAPYTTVYTLPFGYMAQTCSIYFTVAAAVDCFVNVCWPTKKDYYCNVRRAKQICIIIVVLSIMYNSLRFPQFNLRRCVSEDTNVEVIEICPTTLFYTINSVYNIYMYMVLMTLLPFFFLLCINAIIVKRQSSQSSDGESKNEGTSDDTITMIMVVILFLACNTLALVVNIIENFAEPSAVLLNCLTDTSNFLVIFNSSVNCIVYYIFNVDYREMFIHYSKRLLVLIADEYCCCFKRRSRHYSSYQPVSTRLVFDRNNQNNNNNSNGDLILPLGSKSDRASFAESESISSPIWQPITSRTLPNVDNWPNTYNPSNVEDEIDSGWDEGSQLSNRAPKRWLAEVNIVDCDHRGGGRQPHIYVRPLAKFPTNDTISITAL